MTEQDWGRVGAYIEARIHALGLTKAEVSRRSGVSDVTLNGYLAGAPIRRADKARGLAEALRWTIDSFDAVAEGGEPTEAGGLAPVTMDDRLARLEAKFDTIEQLLRDNLSRKGRAAP